MNSVYESIIAGLDEAVADARGEINPLERCTVELPERVPLRGSLSPAVSGRPSARKKHRSPLSKKAAALGNS